MAAVGLQKTLGFEILPEVKPGEVEARFTVTEAVAQPYGYCSGGTMLALEETMAGAGSRRIAGEDAMPLGINGCMSGTWISSMKRETSFPQPV